MFSLLFCIYEKQLRISGIRPRVKRQEKYYISPGLFFTEESCTRSFVSYLFQNKLKERTQFTDSKHDPIKMRLVGGLRRI